MITIVDYGLGNIQAFVNIYKRLNIDVTLAVDRESLRNADKIILPGVGSFDWAMTLLNRSGMREVLDELVLVNKRPVLGICVGMQMMARRSEEGHMAGLGWVGGEVREIRPKNFAVSLPHMGWNDVLPRSSCRLFTDLPDPRFYFLHSYYFCPDQTDSIAATTTYGDEFAAAVGVNNVFGTQFHPEKSHSWGIRLLRNFATL